MLSAKIARNVLYVEYFDIKYAGQISNVSDKTGNPDSFERYPWQEIQVIPQSYTVE